LPKQKETNAHHRVKDKESIISLKPRVVVFLVVIGVKIPKKTMHNVFVAKPSHKLHNAKSNYKNNYI
jgi:hypothetical protein